MKLVSVWTRQTEASKEFCSIFFCHLHNRIFSITIQVYISGRLRSGTAYRDMAHTCRYDVFLGHTNSLVLARFERIYLMCTANFNSFHKCHSKWITNNNIHNFRALGKWSSNLSQTTNRNTNICSNKSNLV